MRIPGDIDPVLIFIFILFILEIGIPIKRVRITVGCRLDIGETIDFLC